MHAAAHIEPVEYVDIDGRRVAFDDVVREMDEALFYEACTWAGYGATPQAIVDQYRTLHANRHGAAFTLAA